MTISKDGLKLFIIWLTIVGLGSVNATVYALNDREQQTYNQAIASLEKDIETKRIALIREQASVPQHAEATEATTEEKGIINALNNGQAVADVTSSTKQDCSKFEKKWRQFTDSNTCAFYLKHAVGDLKLLIVQFAAPDFTLDNPDHKKFFEAIANKDEKVVFNNSEQTTFNYLKPYFESEAKKFDTPFTLSIDQTPLIQLTAYPPFAGKTRQEQLREIGKSQKFFLQELLKANLDLRDYDAIAITVFSPQQDEFISFALSSIRANITKISVNNYDLDYDVSVLAHETAHLFGTNDQYIEGTGACQDGTADEYVTGSFQSLMCRTGTIDLTTPYRSVINKRAAREMGWIKG